jgi:hypothetical protein
MVYLPERQELRQAARDVERIGAVIAEEGLPRGGHEQDAAVGREAAHHHVGPEPGHAPRGAALRGHQVHLGMLLVAAHEREPLPVRRKTWCRGFTQACRQAPGGAALRVDGP